MRVSVEAARHTLTVKASGGSIPPLATKLKNSKMTNYDWSKEKVEKAVKNNTCYRDVLRELEIPARGRNTDTLKAKITEYNLDISHFNFVSKTKGQKAYKDSSHYLHENSNIQSFKLKEKLFKDGIKENKCEICGASDWLGNPLNCQLHHINGNHTDNRLENLQILCPNCHSQTDTYSGTANKGNTIQRVCIDCGKPISDKSANRCSQCAAKVRRKVSEEDRPTKEELLQFIETESFTTIGKRYKVSDNTIRKWCKGYGIPSTKHELGQRIQGTIPNKICPHCGKEYHPESRTQVCCSRKCQIEYAKYKDILKDNGSPIIDKETFVSYAQTHKKNDVYRHFNITRNKYVALEYYFIKLNRN